MCSVFGPQTHHACSSPGHLQLPEKVFQLLPLNVAITCRRDRGKYSISATHWVPQFQYYWHTETPWALMWSQCHHVKQIQTGIAQPWYWSKHEPTLPSPLAQKIWLTMQADHLSKCSWSCMQGGAINGKLFLWDFEGDDVQLAASPLSFYWRSIWPSVVEFGLWDESIDRTVYCNMFYLNV